MDVSPVLIPPVSPGRILVVDDDVPSRRLLKDLLTARGHSVTEATDGEEGITAARRELPDVILLDVMMPILDGFEVCRQLKSDPVTSVIYILMITSLTERKHRIKGIECGANDFLTKPVEVDEVLLRVRNAIMTKQIMDELQLRRSEESLDDTLLRQLGSLSTTNPGFGLGLLSIGAKMMSLRMLSGHLENSERERLYAIYEQIVSVLAKAGGAEGRK